MNKKIIILSLLLFAFTTIYAEKQPIPELNSRVTDITGTLTQSEILILEQKLLQLEEQNGTQLVILFVSTTGNESIEEYSMRVAEEWKIGQKEKDNGVILLIAKNDRKLRIEVGYGLESIITDAYANRIIEDYITPEFKTGDFYKGINNGIDQIIKLINGEPIIISEKSKSILEIDTSSDFMTLIMFIIFFGPMFFLLFRKKPILLIFISILVVGFDILYALIYNNHIIAIGLIAYSITLFLITFFTRNYSSTKSSRKFNRYSNSENYESSSSSMFDDSSSSFGGGGGSFGGGGASGSW